jgi:hypothetical protein
VRASSNVISLDAFREALAERFPEARRPRERHWTTGWAAIDDEAQGLRFGAITEVCCAEECSGFFLDRLIASAREQGRFLGLVEVGRTFDPRSYEAAALARVLTVFAETAELSVKATDLLLRDGNLPLVLLDLQAAPLRSLGRIPANTWHRFQRLVERSETALVVLTPQPLVEAARIRIALHADWNLADLKRPRAELLPQIAVQIFRRGRAVGPMDQRRSHTA